ncbi:DinB family protein [Rubinisphaera margarita]|uniref:DinB family protein n=1 Tax=Rubinisphaera margarita TaxID=2909586 RepID=UPI001EE94EB1|nr:DinB family protein [Rubinisphaera margarita]MCG6156393.1 DinB family protein [Rubinisphaera margarita]
MSSVQLLRRLHEHRIWVNRRLREAVRPLSRDQLRRSFPMGQGTVWLTLTHLLAAEYIWLEALDGNDSPVMPGDRPDRRPGNQQGEDALRSLDELITRWEQFDARWLALFERMTDGSLSDTVSKISTSSGSGKRHTTSAADVLLHVCTHAQYTTAQLVNMLRQLGQTDLPDVMLITMAREEKR